MLCPESPASSTVTSIGTVASKRQAQLCGFVRDGEVRLPRNMVMHLDEIDATFFEDRFACVLSVSDAPVKRPVWRRIVEDRSRRHDFRSEHKFYAHPETFSYGTTASLFFNVEPNNFCS